MKNVLKHFFIVAGILFLLAGIPFLRSDYFKALINGADTTTSASVILDAPSGEYVVLINREIHEKSGKLNDWISFFSGEPVSYIFEDISCLVPSSDAAGMEMADSYRSRLPENQMRLSTEDATLILSKAVYGKYDIIVLSSEAASAFGFDMLSDDDKTLYLTVSGSTT